MSFPAAGFQSPTPPWAPNSGLLNVTAPGLRAQQDSLDASLQAIQTSFDPADSVVLTVTGQNVYRFMMYYLPEFVVLQLDPSMHAVLPARGRRQGNWVEQSGCLFSDASVRQLKGAGRPLMNENDRAEILAALESVDYVTIFDDISPRSLIAELLPDVLVKGGDYALDQIHGREEVEGAGGRVVSLPFVEGASTSAIIEKLKGSD